MNLKVGLCGLAVFSYMSGPAFMAKDLFGSKDKADFTFAWYVMLACVVGFALLIVSVIRIKKLQKK